MRRCSWVLFSSVSPSQVQVQKETRAFLRWIKVLGAEPDHRGFGNLGTERIWHRKLTLTSCQEWCWEQGNAGLLLKVLPGTLGALRWFFQTQLKHRTLVGSFKGREIAGPSGEGWLLAWAYCNSVKHGLFFSFSNLFLFFFYFLLYIHSALMMSWFFHVGKSQLGRDSPHLLRWGDLRSYANQELQLFRTFP